MFRYGGELRTDSEYVRVIQKIAYVVKSRESTCLKEVDTIRPNFRDFEVEIEALQTTDIREKDRVEKHKEVKEEIKTVQNRI